MRKGSAECIYKDCRAKAEINLDGEGKATVNSGSGFLDHMLTALAKTSGWDLKAEPEPGFHKIGALGAAIGQALDKSLSERRGIKRYGSASVPMDEALADVSLDFSGRPYLILSGELKSARIGDFESDLLAPFLEALAVGARLTLHVRFYGENDHHKIESIFKALGLAVRQAAGLEGTAVPSTKGLI
jgi:imidazoleglycerol-phosphate dehydratase